jgi:predicted DNA-binding transcriptional regulator AlpA
MGEFVAEVEMKLNTVSRQKQQFLSEREVEELGLASRRTLQSWRLLGRGPRYIKVSRSVRYRLGDIEEWLAAQTVTPAADSQAGRIA